MVRTKYEDYVAAATDLLQSAHQAFQAAKAEAIGPKTHAIADVYAVQVDAMVKALDAFLEDLKDRSYLYETQYVVGVPFTPPTLQEGA